MNAPVTPWHLPNPRDIHVHHSRPRVFDREQGRMVVARIHEFLQSFGIPGRVTGVKRGAAATQYLLDLAPGIPFERLERRQQDLRIQLGRPGLPDIQVTAAGGLLSIDMPEVDPAEVYLLDLIEDPKTKGSHAAIPLLFGRTTDGDPALVDLVTAPHAFIGGASGMGKSVCLRALVHQLLLRFAPDELRLTLIDTKRNAFTAFRGVPHLSAPHLDGTDVGHIVTDPREAIDVMRAIDNERDRRNTFNEAHEIDTLAEHIQRARAHGERPLMPYRVVVMDEVADLVTALDKTKPGKDKPSEYDRIMLTFQRIASAGRSAGIHLILATQYPKAENLPTAAMANVLVRAAFRCHDELESRQILGQQYPYAAKLQPRGDAYLHCDAGKLRMAGVFVTTEERNKLVAFWRRQAEAVAGVSAAPGPAGTAAR